MILKSWDKLPDNMRTEEVRPYYDLLKKHTFALILKRCFDVIMRIKLRRHIRPTLAKK